MIPLYEEGQTRSRGFELGPCALKITSTVFDRLVQY